MSAPLMPKATAVWLVENTALTFDQIAQFCGVHPLEVKGVADGEVFQGIVGLDPVAQGQLTQREIDRCSANPKAELLLNVSTNPQPTLRAKGPRYTPVSRRQDRPDAIAWALRNHPELSDAQLCKLMSTTKPTIKAIRERSHWNSTNIKPIDPVTLGLCTQIELDKAVEKAAVRRPTLIEEEDEEEGLETEGHNDLDEDLAALDLPTQIEHDKTVVTAAAHQAVMIEGEDEGLMTEGHNDQGEDLDASAPKGFNTTEDADS